MKKIIRGLVFLVLIYIIVSGSFSILKDVVFPYKYKSYVTRYGSEYNVDPFLILSVMKAESNFNEEAKSNKDALGIMQITKSTGAWIAEQQGIVDFNTDLLLDPEVSIRFGTWYLNNLYEEFGDWTLVIAAYNAGRGRVSKWLEDPRYSEDGKQLTYIPYKETDKYVKKVKAYNNIYKSFYGNN